MIFGALIAASQDLSFSVLGYTYVMVNNVFTASNGVVLKKKLEAKDLGKNGLLFYNSLFMLPLAFAIAGWTGDLEKVICLRGNRKDFTQLFIVRPGILSTGTAFGSMCNFSAPA